MTKKSIAELRQKCYSLANNMGQFLKQVDVMSSLLNAFKESIEQTNADKQYWLSKLSEMADISNALSDYLKELNEQTDELQEAIAEEQSEERQSSTDAIVFLGAKKWDEWCFPLERFGLKKWDLAEAAEAWKAHLMKIYPNQKIISEMVDLGVNCVSNEDGSIIKGRRVRTRMSVRGK